MEKPCDMSGMSANSGDDSKSWTSLHVGKHPTLVCPPVSLSPSNPQHLLKTKKINSRTRKIFLWFGWRVLTESRPWESRLRHWEKIFEDIYQSICVVTEHTQGCDPVTQTVMLLWPGHAAGCNHWHMCEPSAQQQWIWGWSLTVNPFMHCTLNDGGLSVQMHPALMLHT